MLDVLNYVSGDLDPTRTYGRRSYCWIPADRADPEWDRRLGNLSIKVQHARGYGCKYEMDTYAVEEVDAKPGVPGRVFLLVKLTDPDQEQPYECVIGPQSRCTCKAAKCRVPADEGTDGCKHRDALGALINGGYLDDPAAEFATL